MPDLIDELIHAMNAHLVRVYSQELLDGPVICLTPEAIMARRQRERARQWAEQSDCGLSCDEQGHIILRKKARRC